MSISSTPWMGSVTLTTGSTVYDLQTLILALPDATKPNIGPSGVLRACYLELQLDPAAGAAKGYIGNRANMSATDCGRGLTAGQVWTPPSTGGNLYRLDQIYVLSDTSSTKMFISFVTR